MTDKRDLTQAEDSVPLRLVVYLMTMTCIAASCIFVKTSWPVVVLTIAIASIGSVVSYQSRNEKQNWMQWVVIVGVLGVGANAAGEFMDPTNGATDFWGPVVHFIAGVFALHTFDLKSRSDINLSALLGAMILCFLSPVVRSLYFGLAVFNYICLGTVMLYFDCMSRTLHNWLTKPMQPAPVLDMANISGRRKPRGSVYLTVALLPIISAFCFLLMPRSDNLVDNILSSLKHLDVNSVLKMMPSISPKMPDVEPPRHDYVPGKKIEYKKKREKDNKDEVDKELRKRNVETRKIDPKKNDKKPKEDPKKDKKKDKKEEKKAGSPKEPPKKKPPAKHGEASGERIKNNRPKDNKLGNGDLDLDTDPPDSTVLVYKVTSTRLFYSRRIVFDDFDGRHWKRSKAKMKPTDIAVKDPNAVKLPPKDANAPNPEPPPETREKASGGQAQTTAGKDKTAAGKDKTAGGKDKTAGGKDKTAAGKDKTAAGKDKTTDGKDQTTDGKDQTTDGKDQATDEKDQTTDGKDQTTDGKDQATDGKDKTAAGKEQTVVGKYQSTDGTFQTTDGKEQSADGTEQTSEGKELTPEQEADKELQQEKLNELSKRETGFGPDMRVDYVFTDPSKGDFHINQASALRLPPKLPCVTLSQSFEVATDVDDAFPSAWLAQDLTYKGKKIVVDDYGQIINSEKIDKGAKFNVTSQWPVYNLKLMRSEPGITEERENAIRDELSNYLELPENLSDEVLSMANDYAGKTGNWFAIAERICVQMRTACSMEIDKPIGYKPADDRVKDFLIDRKAGNNKDFTTAYVIMCRAVGLPARVVYGFNPGTFNKESGTQDIRMTDATSWAEVYIPDYGWVPFDATPGGVMPGVKRDEGFSFWKFLKWLCALFGISLDDEGLTPKTILAIVSLVISAIFLLAGLILAIMLYLKWRKDQRDKNPWQDAAWRVWMELSKDFKKARMERMPSETPTEFVNRINKIVKDQRHEGALTSYELPQALSEFFVTYEAVHFGNKEGLPVLKSQAQELRKLVKANKASEKTSEAASKAVRSPRR